MVCSSPPSPLGEPVQTHPPPQGAKGPATTPIQELSAQLDSFLAKRMLEDPLTEEEAKVVRKKEFVEVTVHGQTTEMLSIEGLEKMFQAEHGSRRIVVPSTDILRHQAKHCFPLDVTHEEAMEEMREEFKKLTNPIQEGSGSGQRTERVL